jgi:hypothetical protein
MKTAHTAGRGLLYRPLFHFVKLSAFLLLMVCMQVQANGFAQQKINLQLQKATLKQLLNEVEKQTLYRFVYHTGTLPADKKLDISVRDAELDQVLLQAFKGLPLNYSVKEDNLVVVFSTVKSPTQDKVVKGSVTGPDNKPLAGVSVLATGTSAGTTTDANGNFSLLVPDKAKTLEFTLVGYLDELVSINKPVINVTMRLSATNLGEVVVTGYTSYSRNKSVSAATTIGGDKINDVPAATFEQALQGRVPGLSISAVSGQPGTSARVLLRGVGSIVCNGWSAYRIRRIHGIEPW